MSKRPAKPIPSPQGEGMVLRRPAPASRLAPRAGAVPRLFPPALEPRLEPAAGRARLLPRNLCLRHRTLRRRPGDRPSPLPCKSHSVLPPFSHCGTALRTPRRECRCVGHLHVEVRNPRAAPTQKVQNVLCGRGGHKPRSRRRSQWAFLRTLTKRGSRSFGRIADEPYASAPARRLKTGQPPRARTPPHGSPRREIGDVFPLATQTRTSQNTRQVDRATYHLPPASCGTWPVGLRTGVSTVLWRGRRTLKAGTPGPNSKGGQIGVPDHPHVHR